MKNSLRNLIMSLTYRKRRFSLQILYSLYKLPEIDLNYLTNGLEIDIENEIILDDVSLPRSHDDLLPLLNIVKKFNPKNVLELGTAYGNIVANICNISSEIFVYTVNALPEQISGTITSCILKKDEIGRVYKKHGFSNRVVQLYQNTIDLELSEYFDGPKVDLAIIDACHDTDYVINDFLKVEPYLRNDGLILLHDTHPSMIGHLAYSYIACMKLKRKGYDIKHLDNTWWGVYRKKPIIY